MNLFATVIPTNVQPGERYPTYIAMSGGISVGPAGDLLLASRKEYGAPIEFRIYAPGTWKEVNVTPVEE